MKYFAQEGHYVNSIQQMEQRLGQAKLLHDKLYADGFAAGVKAGILIGAALAACIYYFAF